MISVGFDNSIYVGAKDKVVVTVWTSLALALSDTILFVRFIDEQCQESLLKFFVNTTSDRIRVRNFFAVSGPGHILSCALFVDANTATPRRGQMYATVGIAQFKDGDDTHVSTFLSGYVIGRKGLSFPPAIQEDSFSGSGLLRFITGTNPGPGAVIIETVPTNVRWRLNSLRVDLSTSATVNNRRVGIRIDDSTDILLTSFSTSTQAASVTRTYQAFPIGAWQAELETTQYIPIPVDLFLLQGWRILSSTVNQDTTGTGDNFTAPLLGVEEWIED